MFAQKLPAYEHFMFAAIKVDVVLRDGSHISGKLLVVDPLTATIALLAPVPAPSGAHPRGHASKPGPTQAFLIPAHAVTSCTRKAS